MIARPDGFVYRRELDAVRAHLRSAKADTVLAAVAVYDQASALERRSQAEGSKAHEAPRQARSRHHDAVIADVLAVVYLMILGCGPRSSPPTLS